MPAFICTACGTQYPPSDAPPNECTICIEERQYVPPNGQSWTTLDALAGSHFNAFRQYEPGVLGIGSQPRFAIGQRALLVCTPAGNVLWDCISLLDEATVTLMKGLGGVQAIGISHPHFYTTQAEWSRAFGDAPVYLHADDRRWVMRPHGAIRHWEGESVELVPGLTMIRCGGHFPGGSILHWTKGADGRGVLCTSDIFTVTEDRKFLTFMRSYPNFIPLSARGVRAVASAADDLAFDRIYGHYFDRVIPTGAKQLLKTSVERYAAAVDGRYDPDCVNSNA